VDRKEGKPYDGVLPGSLVFSPDGKRTAYVARTKNWLSEKIFVVTDGIEGKPYKGVGMPIFSLNSQHVIYGAQVENKTIVVMDEKKGNPFDGILRKPNEAGIFVASDHFHYLGFRGDEIYYVEEQF
jgi:hypothetical protein